MHILLEIHLHMCKMLISFFLENQDGRSSRSIKYLSSAAKELLFSDFSRNVSRLNFAEILLCPYFGRVRNDQIQVRYLCCQVYKHLPDRTLVYEVTIWLPIYCQKDKFVAFAALELFNWPNANLFFAMCTSLPGTIPFALFYYAVILALCTLLHCVHCLLCSDLCQGVSCSCGHRR